MKESGLKRIRVLLFVASALAVLPFLANCFGYSIYVHLNAKEESRIFGASEGVCHLARQPMVEELSQESMDSMMEGMSYFPDYRLYEWVDTERTKIFVESGHGLPLLMLSFSSRSQPDYSSVAFPWLLIPLVIFVAALAIPKRIAERQSVEEFS